MILRTFIAILLCHLAACGDKIDISALPQFRYYVESEFTGTGENYLVTEGFDSALLNYKISGSGFEADVPLNKEIRVEKRVKLHFLEVGDYGLNLEFFKPDGTPLFSDSLHWSFSLESPENPIVGFSEVATNDPFTVLLVSESRDPGTDEIWIEGDIAPEETPEGSWRPIPTTSKVPLKLSPKDGMKTVRVKLRNKFKIPTDVLPINILLKSQGPTACSAELRGPGTVLRNLPIRLSAENSGPLYYRVFGDIEGASSFMPFTSPGIIQALLSNGFGEKKITVQIKDEAENYCLRQEFKVNYSDQYKSSGISIKGDLLWTDAATVSVLPRVDHFSDETVEMNLHGDIVADAESFGWRPFQAEAMVTLAPSNGHRWVRVQFRVNGVLSSFRYTPIYFKPFVYVQGSSSPYLIVPSNILGLDRLSIVGCQENYEVQVFANSFTCTPSGSSEVIVHYDLSDGTRVTRSALLPP